MNNGKIAKERKRKLAFKMLYENELFQFGFAEIINEEVEILTEFELEPNEFKLYFKKMLAAVTLYNNETGKNMIEEIYKEV